MRGIWTLLCIHLVWSEEWGIFGLEDDTGESSGSDPAVIDLVQSYPENEALLASVPHPYEIIYPVQLRKNRKIGISTLERRGRHLVHMEQTLFQIDLFGEKHKLKLHLNVPLLSTSMRKKYFLEDKTQIISETVDHCYYHGTVKHFPKSTVALSTCRGLSGVIQLHNATYIIHPLRGGDLGMNHPHVLYHAVNRRRGDCGVHDGRWLSYKDLHEEEYVRRVKARNADPVRKKREAEDSTKVIDLALVIDHKLFRANNNTSEREIVQKIIMVANIADMYYKVMNVNLSIVYIEVWNTEDQMKMDRDMRKTLQNFVLYKKQSLFKVPHDTTHLLSSYAFSTEDIGLAIPESICTERAIGITRVPSLYQPVEVAATLTHMIGHNLGMKHDTDKCDCEDLFGCLMKDRLLIEGEEHLKNFSSCSQEFFTDSLSLGLGNCLLPRPSDVAFPEECGNGIVERGEQCDCKSPQECLLKDPCCEPQTCLLQPWAFCNHGPCCRNCSILPRTHICRPASNECDVPEYCGGKSGLCPHDSYIQDGTRCSSGEGHCFLGECPTHLKQCHTIWGRDSLVAETNCYRRFNPLGTMNGHCGPNVTTHLYNKCEKEDVMCGLLHCIGGNPTPLIGDKETFTKMFVSVKGDQFVCNILNSYSIPEFPQDGVVKDGTTCAPGRVCVNHVCRDVSSVMKGVCPTNNPNLVCSGHGVCTNELKCVCNPFWLTEDCSVPMFRPTITTTTTVATTNRIDYNATVLNESAIFVAGILKETSGVVPNKVHSESISTKMLMIILAGVAGSLLVILGFFMLCYRRRSPTSMSEYGAPWTKKKKKKEGLSNSRPASLSSEECANTNRIIKFGSMPSYREEKVKEFHELKRRILQGANYVSDEEANAEEGVKQKGDEGLINDPPPRPSPPPVSLDKMPERGILKKGPKTKGKRVKKVLKTDAEGQKGSQPSGSDTESKEGSKLELSGNVNSKEDKVLSGSECSAVPSDYESMDTAKEEDCLLKSVATDRPGTPTSQGSGASQGSREHLDAQGKVVHIRNIDDLIKTIEEQVGRQSPADDSVKNDANPDCAQNNFLRPEDIKTDANVQTSPQEFPPTVHITDNPMFPIDDAASETGSSESALSTNSSNDMQNRPRSPELPAAVLTAPAPPSGPLLNFSPLHVGLQSQHHAQFSPEDNLFTCTHFSPVGSPTEAYPKSAYSPISSPEKNMPYRPIFTPPPKLPPVQFTPSLPTIPQTGLNQNIGKLSSFLPRPDYVPIPSSPANSSSSGSNCSSVAKSDSPKEEKDNIPRIWQAPHRSNIPARRGPPILSGHFGKVPAAPSKNTEPVPDTQSKNIPLPPPVESKNNTPNTQSVCSSGHCKRDAATGEMNTNCPKASRPKSYVLAEGKNDCPREPRSRPASTSLHKPVILPKPNNLANSAAADDRPVKPNNLPLTNNLHSKSPNSPEFYKTFSPIFPPHLLSADHFHVALTKENMQKKNINDLSPQDRPRAPHSPECNINPYSPDTSPNEQPAKSSTPFQIGIRPNLNTGSKAKLWNSRDKQFNPGLEKPKESSPKHSKSSGKQKKKMPPEPRRKDGSGNIDKDLILDI